MAIGVTWVFVFTLDGEFNWNLGWTLFWWLLFTVGWVIAGNSALSIPEKHTDNGDERIAELEERVTELENEPVE